ncbi:MAG: dihydrodipicolinate synthase family protein [Burkholderiaceae bacterium]|nr:dihydrodipicolinate synthase family protein [Burkholderiaceae bacterium]
MQDQCNWNGRFDGLWLPLVTPFEGAAAERLDPGALARLVRQLAAQGVAGFVACGSTGEAAMLSADEQQALLATVVQAAAGLPVLMGLSGLSGVRPEAVAARARQLADSATPPQGWLLAPPAYVRPSQSALVDWYQQVAEATPLPLVAYDIPARCGVRLQPATLLALAEHPRIVAVKDCSGDRAAAEAILCDGRLALLAGNDDELFDQLARGAVGAITASAHLGTAHFVRLLRLLREDGGSLAEARALWRRLAPLTAAAFAEPNPAVIKGALAAQGWLQNRLRAPMAPAQAASVQVVLQALQRLEGLSPR